MSTPTYIPLATVTLGSSASSVIFSSIPATYRDLVLVVNGTPSSSDSSINLQMNGDVTSSNYPAQYAFGNGDGGSGAGTLTSNGLQVTYTPSGGIQTIIAQIMDYSATDKHKTVLARGNGVGSGNWVQMWAGRWANTSAITQIQIVFVQARTWNAGSTFNLYGIAG